MSGCVNGIHGIDTIDTMRLSDYLGSRIDGFPKAISARKFDGGQSNPTFLLQENAATDSTGARYVLRKQPPGKLLKSAHAVDREFRVMSALSDTTVPVPKMCCLCEDKGVIGEMFFVMQYLDGVTYWDGSLPELERDARAVVYREMVDALASLASVDYVSVGLGDFGKPGNYFERQLQRWSKQYRLSQFGEIAAMEWIMEWLLEHLPSDDGLTSLVHGDFRLDNLKYSAATPGEPATRLIGVLDWELSTLGHPLADLANLCMQLRLPAGMANMSGLKGKDVETLGIPTEEQLVNSFSERTGITVSNWHFYIAFSLFRIAAILQGVARRAQDGNASNPMGANLGQFVEPLADIAVDVVRNSTNE